MLMTCSTKASCLLEVSAGIEKSERVGLPLPFLYYNATLIEGLPSARLKAI
jgi:hypothetical protein